jgi:F-type H+-transporting ATPase subunit a
MLYAILSMSLALEPTQQEGTQQAGGAVVHMPQPPAEVIFDLFGVPVTNSIFTAWCVIALLVLFAFFSTRNMRMVPSGLQNFWELVVELWIGVVEQSMGRRGRRFIPLIATAFLFILFSNWIGILPVVGTVTIKDPHGHDVPVFRSANSDLNVTAAMAVIVILIAEFLELRSLGLLGYLKGFFIPNPLRWLEIFTRALSLSLRLFGNIFAGEVLVATMIGVAPIALFAFLGLELFVGLIQALIFSMLTLVFFTIATAHEHAQHDEPHPRSAEVPSAGAVH